jgi:hypothetical protein
MGARSVSASGTRSPLTRPLVLLSRDPVTRVSGLSEFRRFQSARRQARCLPFPASFRKRAFRRRCVCQNVGVHSPRSGTAGETHTSRPVRRPICSSAADIAASAPDIRASARGIRWSARHIGWSAPDIRSSARHIGRSERHIGSSALHVISLTRDINLSARHMRRYHASYARI